MPAGTHPAATPASSPHAAKTSPETVRVDAALQRHLERSWPADLPPTTARFLVRDAKAVLAADATGVGRGRWPTVFGAGQDPVVASFSRVRVQAAVARRDGSARQAVVHLVWAAADAGGSYAQGRIADVYFTLTSTEGHPVWTPQSLH
ncbi:hypothetical protein ACICHK_00265 [Streptomyces sp. AHU1]|uniref:hypothetical protein n=1 Tax=Streptomyces sp. AHU1 TaxID=3377215 RepID=UPI003877A41F